MRILLVEPENNAAAYLRKGLTENGFAVDVARHANDALELVGQINYDLLVYDGATRPPGVPLFRSAAQQMPVLFLSPHDGKPVGFSDLLTRVRSMLHWGPGAIDEVLEIADLQVDLVRHRAMRGGSRLDLTPKEYLLLSLLMRKAGEVLSRAHCRPGLGHQFREQHQFRRRAHPPAAIEGGRSVSQEADSHGARHRIRPGRPRIIRDYM